jgi:hypothetical protein
MKTYLLVALCLSIGGCPSPAPPPPVPPAPPDASDAAIGPQPTPTGDRCTDAYSHLVGIGCVPAVADAATWVAACRNDRAQGLFDLRCIDTHSSPSDIEKTCHVKCAR